jgi:diguanylate cyclase (GGDEF)-like protein
LVISLLSQHSAATVRSTASLMRQAQRDPLTGLHNRRILTEVLTSATPGDVVIIIDIDHFKGINDDGGHSAGDDLLTNFARVLVRDIRENDIAIRFGGDEFVLYLPSMCLETAKTVLERFHLDWSRQPNTATFSAGIAAVREGRDGADAFGEADRLLYDAKAAGRNQWATPVDSGTTAPPTQPTGSAAR